MMGFTLYILGSVGRKEVKHKAVGGSNPDRPGSPKLSLPPEDPLVAQVEFLQLFASAFKLKSSSIIQLRRTGLYLPHLMQ